MEKWVKMGKTHYQTRLETAKNSWDALIRGAAPALHSSYPLHLCFYFLYLSKLMILIYTKSLNRVDA